MQIFSSRCWYVTSDICILYGKDLTRFARNNLLDSRSKSGMTETEDGIDMEAEQKLRNELKELTEALSAPDAFSDPKIGEKNRRRAELEEVVSTLDQKELFVKQLAESNEILRENDSELSELAKIEIPELEAKIAATEEKLTELLTPKDPNDHKNCVIEIRAGAGGDECAEVCGGVKAFD